MFDTEYPFDELPLLVGTTEIAVCSGTAHLEGETGPHDYGFVVTGIALDGNVIGDYRDKRTIRISRRSDDPFCVLLFEQLARRIEADSSACEFFHGALRDHRCEAA